MTNTSNTTRATVHDDFIVSVQSYNRKTGVSCFGLPLSQTRCHRGPANRKMLRAIKSDISRPGVYLWVRSDPQNAGKMLVYVGSSGDVADRLAGHDQMNDAQAVYVLTASGDDLNFGHARLAEAVLQMLAEAQPHASLVGQKARVFEMGLLDRTTVARFVKESGDLLAIADFPLHHCSRLEIEGIPFIDAEAFSAENVPPDVPPDTHELYEFVGPAGLEDYLLTGTRVSADAFIIDAGTHFRVATVDLTKKQQHDVDRLIAAGILGKTAFPDGRLVLLEPYTVKSPRHACWLMMKAGCELKKHWRIHDGSACKIQSALSA